jgi:hypothetical protein
VLERGLAARSAGKEPTFPPPHTMMGGQLELPSPLPSPSTRVDNTPAPCSPHAHAAVPRHPYQPLPPPTFCLPSSHTNHTTHLSYLPR